MSEQTFDLVVLGSGPAASRIATACAESKNVAVVESRTLGGTCALRGCNPKKVLARAAELIGWTERSDSELINRGKAQIDWQQLIEFTRSFTEPVTPSTRKKYADAGITVFEGTPRFVDESTLAVGDELLRATNFVIATGARPADLDISGSELVTTSDDFFEIEELPRRVLFVGGGYISTEFAHVARRAGAEVTIVDRNARPLQQFDPDLVDRLVESMRNDLGITMITGSAVKTVSQQSDGSFSVEIDSAKGTQTLEFDLVVHGGGRVPSLDGLDLEVGGVDVCTEGIVVNEYLQSVSNPLVYAAGDCAATGQPKLTPIANEEGRTVVKNLTNERTSTADYGSVPQAVFSVPALASVGLTEADAGKQNLQFEVRKGDMSNWGSIRKVGQHAAAYKILIEKQSDRVLGAHLLAVHAAETINLFAMAMKHGLTATDVKSVLFVFPTFASDVRSML